MEIRTDSCNSEFPSKPSRKLVCILSVLLLFSVFSIFGSVHADEGDTYPVVITSYGYFSTTVIKETNGALTGGVDAGDVDNDGQNELVIGSWNCCVR